MTSEDSVFDTFFDAVTQWRKWVTSSLEANRRYQAAALSKPEGAKHCPHIHMDERGEYFLKCGHVWHKLTRESDKPFARYEAEVWCVIGAGSRGREKYKRGRIHALANTEGETVTLVERSGDHPEKDGGWQINPRTLRFGHNLPEIHYVDRNDIASAIKLCEAGLAFADVLLEHRESVMHWIDYTAKCEGRNRKYDWEAFCEQFLPDTSQKIPNSAELEAALAKVFLELAKPK